MTPASVVSWQGGRSAASPACAGGMAAAGTCGMLTAGLSRPMRPSAPPNSSLKRPNGADRLIRLPRPCLETVTERPGLARETWPIISPPWTLLRASAGKTASPIRAPPRIAKTVGARIPDLLEIGVAASTEICVGEARSSTAGIACSPLRDRLAARKKPRQAGLCWGNEAQGHAPGCYGRLCRARPGCFAVAGEALDVGD
jgi:hypothetical protein